MSFIQNLFTSRDNNAQGNTYVGQQDRIWWNPDTNAFYYSDGNTAGGIPIGGGGAGAPGGPTNSIQYNLGGGSFGGTANLVISSAGLSAVGNITAAWFIGNVSATGNVNLGNLYITDQTIGGKNLNANIILLPEGDGYVTVPKIAIDSLLIDNVGGKIQFETPANVDIQLDPGVGGNILTAGTIKPTGNNIAGIGDSNNRYTDLWLGAGNINLIDQTLSQNQQIYADNGNLIVANASGLSFGNFRFYGNTMALANAAANILIGTANATGWVQFNRAVAVSSLTPGVNAFTVGKNGLTSIYAPATIANTESALNIVGSSSGNSQPRNFSGTMIQVTGQDDQAARISFDAFGANGAQNAYTAIAARAARGTVDSPQSLQANDVMLRLTSQGWTGNGVYASSIARLNFAVAENFTSNAAVGTYANIQLTPIGSNVIKTITGFSANGVNFPNAIAGGTGNLGITFQDGTFQNTAYLSTNVVSSLTAGAGINLSGSTGNVTITNTGILGINGTANRVQVASNVGGLVTLTTPQDLNTTANVTLYSLTVTDLSIIGNVSNVIPSVVGGKIIYVANTATVYNDINVSGLVTGNAANGFSAGMLYDTASNTWQFNSGNSWGITANTVYGNSAFLNNFAHVGYANATVDYGNATIQADSSVDNFSQIVQQNHFQGANASSDFVAVANNGDESNYYINMGINSNVYNNADYAVTKANDGYLYVNGGNLIIGTQTAAKTISFFTGGTNSTSFIRATLTDAGLSVVGNINSANTISSNLVTGVTLSASGNVTGNNILSLNTVSAQGNVIAQNVNTGIVSATGNITGGNIRAGSGSISTSGNVVAGNLITATTIIDGGVSTLGNITGANILTSGLISATGNVNAANVIANLAVIGSTLSILGNIQGGNLLTAGIISTSGNATFGNIQTTGRVISTGNVDAGNIRTAGIVTATGNVTTAGYFVGDGGFISNITVATPSKIVNGTSYANIAALNGNLVIVVGGNTIETITTTGSNITGYANVTGNVTGGNLLTAGLVSATSTITSAANVIGGNITTAGVVTATGNVTGGNVLTAGIMSSTGNGIHGNILTAGLITATGNITGNYFIGNGSLLTSLTGANVSGTVANATYAVSAGTATSANTAATVTTNAQPNITSVGILSSVSVTGVVTGGQFSGNGNTLSNIQGANVSGQVGNALVAGTVYTAAQPNITSVGTLTSLSITGNVTGGNVLTGGLISATGNITGNYFIGNGSQLTGIVSSYGNTNVNTLLAAWGSNTVSTTGTITAGNITGGNLLTAGIQSSTGNVIGSNVLTGGLISATGNITGGNVSASRFTGNLVGSASNLTVNTSSTAGTWLTGQVNIPAQTIPKNTTSVDVTVTVTGLTTSHKVIVTPAADLNSGIFVSAAYPSSANTLGIQMQNTTGGAITTSAFNLTYMAWV